VGGQLGRERGFSSSACPAATPAAALASLTLMAAAWGKTSWQSPQLWGPGFLCCHAFLHLSSIRCSDLLSCHALSICAGPLNCQVNGEQGRSTLALLAIVSH